MQDLLLYAALGLGAGALVASIALGIVLVYQGWRIINVATSAIAMLATYVYWALRTGYFGFGLLSVPAFALTLVCIAAGGVLSSSPFPCRWGRRSARRAGDIAWPPAGAPSSSGFVA